MAEPQRGTKRAAPEPAVATVDTAGEESVNADTALPTRRTPREDWEVARGPRKTGRLTLIVPGAIHVATGLVGLCAAKAGKLLEAATGNKRVSHMGLGSFLCSLGIVYEVKFEPLGEARDSLQQLVGPLQEDNMNITPTIVCNHISYLDGFVLEHAFKSPRFVVKAEVRNLPGVGKYLEEADAIFVDRSAADSRREAKEKMQKHCADWTAGSRPLLVFPEGTTTNGEGLIKFQNGAFNSGKPVRPVILVYTGHFDPAKPKYVQTGTRDEVEEYSDLEWFKQLLGHVKHSVHVRVLPPYMPSPEERSDPGKYAAGCKTYMEREQVRVRAELNQNSWKTWAGREEGGLDYNFGDITKGSFKRMPRIR